MRRRTWTALGIGATATVATTALLTGLAPSGPDGGGLFTRPAAATELEAFGDCEELRRWYVDAALPYVTPWGLGGGAWPFLVDSGRAVSTGSEAMARTADAASGADDAVGSGPTGTNVQEAGVDEPDLAKTDGRLVIHVQGGRIVLTDATGAAPRRLSTLRLPRGISAAELLLDGDRLVVLGTAWRPWISGGPEMAVDRVMPGPVDGTVRALVVDISEPSSPRVEHDFSLSGSLVSARQHDGTVRVVVSTPSPALDFVTPRRGRAPAEARRENRRLVRESDIGDWLPTVETHGASEPLVDCSDVRHPDGTSGYGTVTVVAFDPADPGDRRTTAVTTSSDLVYSSTDRLYLATTYRRRSGVHVFALDGPETTYLASGEVPGTVRDRWSMSEYDGHLRVATALGKDPWDPDENAVVVLAERGADLVEVGRVGRMGIREQIQSVRWFGEVAVVVTFRQVDPLYTLDLSDPSAPEVVGELKIPGFSSYLHPLGGDLLLGVGQDASRTGQVRGAQAAVFDLHDLTDPRRVDTEQFGGNTEFAAAFDPRGLTYLPESRTVLAPLDDWSRGSRLVVMTVGEDGTISRHAGRALPGMNAPMTRTLPLADGRVALVAGGEVGVLDLPL